MIQTALVAGVAAIACLGVAAMAQNPKPPAPRFQAHVLTVQLPDGSVEQIRYSGAVAPQVALSPLGAFGPATAADAGSPFAMLERMSARMDREMADMMLDAPVMPLPPLAGPGAIQPVDLGKLPAGGESYSFVSTVNGGKACTRSVQITSRGPNQPPRVVSRTSGDCGGQSAAAPQAAPAQPVQERGAAKVTA
jgi:hypothetical protein